MRLINTRTFTVHEFAGDSDKDYAILSHTWGHDECLFQDMGDIEHCERRQGFRKIRYCCEQAVRDGLDWVWADSCCIDKTSTAELSEAINSMFRWYRQAIVCYVFLSDVVDASELPQSCWFNRGWTLQELIAPRNVQFYTRNWDLLGSKHSLQDTIASVTGIETIVLSSGNFAQVCIAKRMAWAADRVTTRVEDQAYSLMGIFDVNMPLIYGEGKKAFLRLQQEILRVSDDQSLFAWGAPKAFGDMHKMATRGSDQPLMHGLLADSAADFKSTHEILQVREKEDDPPPVIYGNAVRIEYPVCSKGLYSFVMLQCTLRSYSTAYLAIPIRNWEYSSYHARCGPLVLVFSKDWSNFKADSVVVKEPDIIMEEGATWPTSFRLLRVPQSKWTQNSNSFNLVEVFCAPRCTYRTNIRLLEFPLEIEQRAHAALIFRTDDRLLRQTSSKREFPICYFAIVLGKDYLPWTIFVPLLSENCTDEDFRDLIRADPTLVQNCMRRSQLEAAILSNDVEKLGPKTTRIEQVLGSGLYHNTYDRHLNRQCQIDISFQIASANLIEDGTLVFIGLQDVWMRNLPITTPFSELYFKIVDDEYDNKGKRLFTPNWYEIDELEWFTDTAI
ncbi:heterokaryon incompatibility protein-domain-containing protein [Xylariaceae sp. FL1019]|nr:heterokaryon incompatibility protein-domain-containing protein [Xylariaceae sp. FL1019]